MAKGTLSGLIVYVCCAEPKATRKLARMAMLPKIFILMVPVVLQNTAV